MAKRSAGLLMYRHRERALEVFLVHPGGPFWAKKDAGAWSIPKGEFAESEPPLEAARREFHEETGLAPEADFIELGMLNQAGGKVVQAWAFEGDFDPEKLTSNQCRIEWPPRSGRQVDFPEVDRGEWFSMPAAREKILKSQQPFLDMLSQKVSESPQV
ncbi:MAG: NUDIX domain-containing protein [Terracidiphilus sp.]